MSRLFKNLTSLDLNSRKNIYNLLSIIKINVSFINDKRYFKAAFFYAA